MAIAYFFCVLAVEHDGNLSGQEMCQVIGQAVDDWDLDITATAEEGLTGLLSITECIGVDEAHPDTVANLIKARKEMLDGNE